MHDGIVRYGDLFRLRYFGRKRGVDSLYLISAEKGGREYYPRMGSIADAVLLMFAAAEGKSHRPDKAGDPVSVRSTIQLVTTEGVVGEANTLGAWKGDHFLRYQPPGRREQEWRIEVDAPSFRDGTLRAGDYIDFFNLDSSERKMAQDQREPSYLSIDPSSRGAWQIEFPAEPRIG